MINSYDIAIIGAGPAGTACALALQGSGLNVVLIDKDIFPRDKVCGDAIPGKAFKAMDSIKPEWGQAMRKFTHATSIRTMKAYAPNGKTISHNWVLFSYNSKRLDFDNFLMQLVRSQTDTTILEHTRIEQLTVETDKVHCQFQDGSSINAAIVIGCDGANSVVKRQLGKFDLLHNDSCAAVSIYMSGVDGIKEDVNEFFLLKKILPGYLWIFPLTNGWVNIGFGVLENKKTKSKKQVHLRNKLKEIIATVPEISHRFKNAVFIGDVKGFGLPLGTKHKPLSGERFMLCGDAASLIDPLQGHGIDNAMWSGLYAAKQAAKCFASANFSADFIKQYDAAVYKKIGPELAKSTFLLSILVKFPWLVNCITWTSRYQGLTQKLIRILKI